MLKLELRSSANQSNFVDGHRKFILTYIDVCMRRHSLVSDLSFFGILCFSPAQVAMPIGAAYLLDGSVTQEVLLEAVERLLEGYIHLFID